MVVSKTHLERADISWLSKRSDFSGNVGMVPVMTVGIAADPRPLPTLVWPPVALKGLRLHLSPRAAPCFLTSLPPLLFLGETLTR